MTDFERFKTGSTITFSEEAVKVMENQARTCGLDDFADLLYKHRKEMRGAVSFIVPNTVYLRETPVDESETPGTWTEFSDALPPEETPFWFRLPDGSVSWQPRLRYANAHTEGSWSTDNIGEPPPFDEAYTLIESP